MSKHRHKREHGGRTKMWVSGNPDVEHEAERKEEGGSGDRKHGGKVHKKHHRMHGGAVPHRMDRPGRKRGGGVGADTSPLSTAHKGRLNDGKGSSSPTDTYGGTPSD